MVTEAEREAEASASARARAVIDEKQLATVLADMADMDRLYGRIMWGDDSHQMSSYARCNEFFVEYARRVAAGINKLLAKPKKTHWTKDDCLEREQKARRDAESASSEYARGVLRARADIWAQRAAEGGWTYRLPYKQP